MEPVETFAVLPDPGPARTVDELVEKLRALKAWAGDPSYETIKNRVNAAWTQAGRPPDELTKKSTVVDCFRTGRRRLNTDLVISVVAALHPDGGYVAQWRQALRVVSGETQASAQVRGQDTLPDDLPGFTGRASELDRLARLVRKGAAGGDAVVISALEGMAGVGKTQLAVHAGHVMVREEPVDRVLFVNLRGFHPDPTQPPADPGAVLDSFLRLLGVPGQQIPREVRARAALYQRRLAGVRALVVLDNAADEEQVRPLLPGSPSCVTLVTSRRSLDGLSPATHLAVEVFTAEEALDFLSRAVPGIPVGPDPDAAARVAKRCGYLPLALGLLAGHMRAKPGWTLTDHADWVDERHRDRRLDDGVELAFGVSYQHLAAERRRLLRLLALHPGHDVDAYAAAALAGTSVESARDDLHRLAADHLVQLSAGRFVFHDLVRAYAAARATDEDPPPARRAALTRLFDHYLHTAAAAMDALWPAERHLRPRVPESATPTPPMADPAAAGAWLDTERVNLVATADHAATHGWPDHTTRLAHTLDRYLYTAGRFNDAVTVHTRARQAANRSGDRTAEAHALTNLGNSYWAQGRLPQAAEQARRAVTLFRDIGDRPGGARALSNLSAIFWRIGAYADAANHAQQALRLFGEIGEGLGEAHALVTLAGAYRRLGRYAPAADAARQALTLYRRLGHRQGVGFALGNLGLAYERQGRYESAAEHLRQSVAEFRELGNRSGEAYVLADLGDVYRAMGCHPEAVDHHRQALALFGELGDTGGEAVALNSLGETLLATGRPDEARPRHATALDLATRAGDRYEQARAHNGLAESHQAIGDADRARHHWEHALAVYTDLGVPEADRVRAHLAARSGG